MREEKVPCHESYFTPVMRMIELFKPLIIEEFLPASAHHHHSLIARKLSES